MSSIDNYFKQFSISERAIELRFKMAKSDIYNDINIIVEKHKILLYYKQNNKTLPKFEDYHNNDVILERNMNIYITSIREAITYLKMLSLSEKEYKYLQAYDLSLDIVKNKI